MPITFACMCGKQLRAKDGSAGRAFTCPACQSAIEVPKPGAVNLGIDLGEPSDFGIDLAKTSPKAAANGAGSASPQVSAFVAPADRVYAPAVPRPCDYEYKMHQMAPRIEIKEGQLHRQLAANYLEEIVNKMAQSGWEFYRVDTFGITENPGCLSGMLGASPTTVSYHVATFRRPRAGS